MGSRTVGVVVVVVVVATLMAAGCTRTFTASAVQPNPLIHPNETLRRSEQITIITGDLELQMPEPASGSQRASVARNHRYPLVNQASFTMVSRDRLRFHMQIDHKWEEWADLRTWEVELVDDKGRHWIPEATEHARVRLITKMWDREQRTARCDQRGRDGAGNCITTMGTYDDGWRNRMTMGNLSVFRGKADFVFYERDLFTPDLRWIKLTVHRLGQAFEFTWRFQELTATSN